MSSIVDEILHKEPLIPSIAIQKGESTLLCSKCLKIPEFKLSSATDLEYNCNCLNSGTIKLEKALEILKLSYNGTVRKCLEPTHENEELISYCVQCKKWMCKICLLVHNNNQRYNTHKLLQTQIELPSHCAIHSQKLFCYCIKCKVDLCYKCLINHSSHKIEYFDMLKRKVKIDDIHNKYKQAIDKVHSHYSEIKDKIIHKLTKKIDAVKKAYTNNQKRNKNLISFVEMITKTYEYTKTIPNYRIVKNLLLCTNFNTSKYENAIIQRLSLEDKVKSVNDFFERNHLVYFSSMNLDYSLYINQAVTTLLPFRGDILYGTENGTIFIYDPKLRKNHSMLSGHNGKITHMSQLVDQRFLSCSSDKTIKIWNKEISGKFICQATLSGHKGNICKAIPISEDRIASCSYDCTIKIWSATTFKVLASMEGHKREVTSILELKDGRLLSNSLDPENTLFFWDLKTYKKKTTPQIKGLGISGERNKLIQIDNQRILLDNTNPTFSFKKNMVYIVNIKHYQIENIIILDCDYIKSTFLSSSNILYLGCSEGIVYQYDLSDNSITKQKLMPDFPTDFAEVDDDYIATGINGGIISFWKTKFYISKRSHKYWL